VSDPTIAEVLGDAAAKLKAAGIEAPLREARLLLGHVTGLAPTALLGWSERKLSIDMARRFDQAVARRLAREPIARILERREFWSLDFRVTPDTLDPRPDTETVVEAALAHLPDRRRALRLIDFGTGTGCILLALLTELPQAFGIGTDRSEAAARVAVENATALGLDARAHFVVGEWARMIGGEFDLVVSNPPYIPSLAIPALEPEVSRYDPLAALDGGLDGLDAYRVLVPEFARILRPGGFAVVEIGYGQADGVAALFVAAGFDPVERRQDLSGIERVIVGRNRAPKK
jgi:release factor glutamine methyltransferase